VAAWLLAALVLLTGCQATVGVNATVRRDGTGTVVAMAALDKAAANATGDLNVHAGDLAPTGWTVQERGAPGGGRVVVARRPFRGGADFAKAMRELGPPFAGFTMTRSRSLFRTKTAVTGAVDLRKGIEAFSDARLTEQLGAAGLGLQSADQTALRRSLKFNVALTVPGAHKTLPLRIGSLTPLRVSATAWNTDVLFPALLAIVLAFALALLMLWRHYN
jgi:hypothetical protein